MADHLVEGLQAEGYAVDVAQDGDEALWLATLGTYDALLMDIMLPVKKGLPWCVNFEEKEIKHRFCF